MMGAHWKRRRLLSLAPILAALSMLATGCSPATDLRATELASTLGLGVRAPADIIEAAGVIEADQIIISSELNGRVVGVHVGEGQPVEQGQILVTLDDSLITARIVGAQADLEAAEAALASTVAGPRPAQVAGKLAAIEQARVRAAGAQQAWDDAIRLRDNPLELDARIRVAEAEARLAEAGIDQARAQLSEAQVRYEASQGGGSDAEKTTAQILQVQVRAAQAGVELAQLAAEGARNTLAQLHGLRDNLAALDAAVHQAEMRYRLAESDIAVREAELALIQAGPLAEEAALAERRVALARAALAALEVQREKLALRAPAPGVIAARVINEGETATAGATLMTLVDLSRVSLEVYVPENQIGHLQTGQPARIQVDSYPARAFEGRVVYIAPRAEFTPRNVQTREDRVNTVFAVKIALDNPEGILKPGMPADATLPITR
jgi:HlyD family secretion protein